MVDGNLESIINGGGIHNLRGFRHIPRYVDQTISIKEPLVYLIVCKQRRRGVFTDRPKSSTTNRVEYLSRANSQVRSERVRRFLLISHAQSKDTLPITTLPAISASGYLVFLSRRLCWRGWK